MLASSGGRVYLFASGSQDGSFFDTDCLSWVIPVRYSSFSDIRTGFQRMSIAAVGIAHVGRPPGAVEQGKIIMISKKAARYCAA
jgi:hypothetical protein